METLTYRLRSSALTLARHDRQIDIGRIQTFLQSAYKTQRDELEEFLRDVVVLEIDIEQLRQSNKLIEHIIFFI